jgi:hypothetical protein
LCHNPRYYGPQQGKAQDETYMDIKLNPLSTILTKLMQRIAINPDDPLLGDYAVLLSGYGLLAEGFELHDPIRYNDRCRR